MIFAPMLVKDKEPNPSSEAAQGPKHSDGVRLAGFGTAYVYDVSQTDGRPLPEFAETTGDPKDYGNKLKSFASKRGIAVEYEAGIAPALGVSSRGKIQLAPGLKAAAEFSVLVHELAHEILHHRKDVQQLPKVVRETQAEAVAYVVSRAVGLETNNAAADYITLYNGDKKTLGDSLAAIQETSAKILDDLYPEKRVPVFEERVRLSDTEPAKAAEQTLAGTGQSPQNLVQSASEVTLDR